MLICHSRHSRWLSNSWLLADGHGGHAVLVDSGAPPEPLLDFVERHQLQLVDVVHTHAHHDHMEFASFWLARGCRLWAHPLEAKTIHARCEGLEESMNLEIGSLHIQPISIPGHTAGQLAFLINNEILLTGDTLFRGSVGGTRVPGHTCFADLRSSIMDKLFTLPLELKVLPGHMEPTSLQREWEHNPFVRAWRGLDEIVEQPCLALGEPASLLLSAIDYDGGSKCWVRFVQGQEDIVPGSRVQAV